MFPNISHVYIKERPIVENVRLCVDSSKKLMKIVEQSGKMHNYDVANVDSLDMGHNRSIECISSSDDEETFGTYYNIEGERIQIDQASINSLAPATYIKDEIIDFAMNRISSKYPNVFVFSTIDSKKIMDASTSHGVDMPKAEFYRIYRNLFISRGREPRPLNETFLSKKMLIFPCYHRGHWILMVVVNPLLTDPNYRSDKSVIAEGLRPSAYYIDSLKGIAGFYSALLAQRLDTTWKSVWTFIHNSLTFHADAAPQAHLIQCHYENNIPSQVNSTDCGPHLVVNAQFVAENYDRIIKGPSPLLISADEIRDVKKRVNEFRSSYKEYLMSCKISNQ